MLYKFIFCLKKLIFTGLIFRKFFVDFTVTWVSLISTVFVMIRLFPACWHAIIFFLSIPKPPEGTDSA